MLEQMESELLWETEIAGALAKESSTETTHYALRMFAMNQNMFKVAHLQIFMQHSKRD